MTTHKHTHKWLCSLGVAAVAAMLLAACTKADSEYNTDYYTYFVYDTNLHQGDALWTAVQPLSVYQFVIVSKNSRTNVHLLTPAGKQTDITVTTETEARPNYSLGAYNGLIIGRDANYQLMAFDRQCPNCLADYGLYKYALSFKDNGMSVYCSHCKRTYSLTNGGYPDTDGRKLLRYKATYKGNILTVHN